MQPRKLTEGNQQKCTVGCPMLDKLLRGGVACGSVTEIVGEASAGKTQACLQLLVTCQWPRDQGGLHGKAMYMYTEGDPSLKRLLAIMSASPSKASPDNIYWERDIVDGQDLYERLQTAEIIMRQPQGLPLRLLIIDSIAHLFRDIGDHPDSSAYVHRTGMLFRISALLRRFADTYNLTVVITNQVSDAFTDADLVASKQAPASKHTGGLRLLSSGRELVPALGLAWANCVNTRLFLSRTEVTIADTYCQASNLLPSTTAPASLPLRYMQVVFSPCLPQGTCLYVVTQKGLRGVDNASIGSGQLHRSNARSEQAEDTQLAGQPKQHSNLRHKAVVTEATSECRDANAKKAICKTRMESAAANASLCVLNRVLADPVPAQTSRQQTTSKLATGVFAASW